MRDSTSGVIPWTLKLPEETISEDDPWHDDCLNRRAIAERLTRLVRGETAPFAMCVDGAWGSGKTFLLRRWRTHLSTEGIEAIYFNAWEDDFCDDPLLAILGQLNEHFKEQPLASVVSRIVDVALPLIRQNALSVLSNKTGLTLELPIDETKNHFEHYLNQRATKDDLKESLSELATSVFKETGNPLVFIIDELDRCRPTFAIELLERVKHIFNTDHLLFVFGVNRQELCAALNSIYGDIDSTVYLRRFFDMEFNLPPADAKRFAHSLMNRLELDNNFTRMSRDAQNSLHVNEFSALAYRCPSLWSYFGLSLRDIDYCVRLISLVGKSVEENHPIHPNILCILVTIKLGNPDLYLSYIQGKARGAEVLNYIDKAIRPKDTDRDFEQLAGHLEASLYLADREYGDCIPRDQLNLRLAGSELTVPEALSSRTKELDADGIGKVLELMRAIEGNSPGIPNNLIQTLGSYIDLYFDESLI